MEQTKTLIASTISTNSTNDSASVHAPNEAANEFGLLNTDNSQPSCSGVTHFRAISKKSTWKRRHEVDSDSDSSHANTDKLTSDHSSDHYNSSDDNEEVNVTTNVTLDEMSLTNIENDLYD